MKQAQSTFQVQTSGPGLYDFTGKVLNWCRLQEIGNGLLTLYIRHTSASLTIQENADPDVRHDLESFFRRLVSRDPELYRHRMEGPDDMPAHIRSALTQTSLSVPISGSRPVLGTWQGIYLYEHRDAPHTRRIVGHLVGE